MILEQLDTHMGDKMKLNHYLQESIPGSIKTYMLKPTTGKPLEENIRKSSLPLGSRKFLKQEPTTEKDFLTFKSRTSTHQKAPE